VNIVYTELFGLGLIHHFVYHSDIKLRLVGKLAEVIRGFLSIDIMALSSP